MAPKKKATATTTAPTQQADATHTGNGAEPNVHEPLNAATVAAEQTPAAVLAKAAKNTKGEAESQDDRQRQLNIRIAEAELKTKELLLRSAERSNAELEAADKRKQKTNEERQLLLNSERASYEARILACRHKSGGTHAKDLRGRGIGSFSVLKRTLMPDNVTIFLQCSRCRMKELTPSLELKLADPERYAKKLEWFNRMLEEAEESGLAPMRGPTFLFTRNGVPYVPAIH